MQKLKNNEARPKFTASYKKKSVYTGMCHRAGYGFQAFCQEQGIENTMF